MTIFSVNPYDRRMERLMMTVPNFAPRGVGFRFTEAQLFITTTAATPTEILTAYWRPAEIASKGPARKANCGAKEKAITEFFQILYTEQ